MKQGKRGQGQSAWGSGKGAVGRSGVDEVVVYSRVKEVVVYSRVEEVVEVY